MRASVSLVGSAVGWTLSTQLLDAVVVAVVRCTGVNRCGEFVVATRAAIRFDGIPNDW